MTKTKALIGSAIIIAGLGAGLVAQYQMLTKLHEENGDLRRQVGQLDMLTEENQRLSNLVATANQQLPRDQFQELLRLRGEISALRRQVSESEKLLAMNHRLAASSGSQVQSPVQLNAGFVSRDSMANVGYATPETAVQTWCWAWAQGGKNMVLARLSPEGRARLEKDWEDLSETQIAERLTGKGDGYHIVSQKEISTDELLFTLYLVTGEEDMLAKFRMKRFGNEWKFAGDYFPVFNSTTPCGAASFMAVALTE